jgi:hypothetical protein
MRPLRLTVLLLLAVVTQISEARADWLAPYFNPSYVDWAVGLYNDSGSLKGNFIDPGNGLYQPAGIALGPDSNIYINSYYDQILKYNGTTGDFMGLFAQGRSGWGGSSQIVFGPDGNLYEAGGGGANGAVLQYNGQSGAFMGYFVPSRSGGLSIPTDLVFGPDGNLYVINQQASSSVLRYNGLTGAFMGAFVQPGSGGLQQSQGLTFGPDGRLYVSSFEDRDVTQGPGWSGDRYPPNGSVLRYDGQSGAFLDAFVPRGSTVATITRGLAFGPDGNLYLGSIDTTNSAYDGILRVNGTTGAFMDVFANYLDPTFFLFTPTQLTPRPPYTPPPGPPPGPGGVPEPSSLAIGGLSAAVLLGFALLCRRRVWP